MNDTIVTVNIKIVKNLGNFESLHMEAGVSTPLLSGETFGKGFDRVYNAVEEKLTERIDEAIKELKAIGE
jgi:hypothetical protein